MIHENIMVYWLIGFIISVVLDLILELCVFDRDRDKIDPFGIVLMSAFLIPIPFAIITFICYLFTGRGGDNNPADNEPTDADADGEGAFLLLGLWIGIVAIGIMYLDSHYGKDYDEEKPKTEVVTQPSENINNFLTLDIEPVPNFCPIFAVEN